MCKASVNVKYGCGHVESRRHKPCGSVVACTPETHLEFGFLNPAPNGAGDGFDYTGAETASYRYDELDFEKWNYSLHQRGSPEGLFQKWSFSLLHCESCYHEGNFDDFQEVYIDRYINRPGAYDGCLPRGLPRWTQNSPVDMVKTLRERCKTWKPDQADAASLGDIDALVKMSPEKPWRSVLEDAMHVMWILTADLANRKRAPKADLSNLPLVTSAEIMILLQIRRWIESKLFDDQIAKLAEQAKHKLSDKVTQATTHLDPANLDEDGRICAICLEEFENPEHAALQSVVCNHVFGAICLDEWSKTSVTCPMCRRRIFARAGDAPKIRWWRRSPESAPIAVPPPPPTWLLNLSQNSARRRISPRNRAEPLPKFTVRIPMDPRTNPEYWLLEQDPREEPPTEASSHFQRTQLRQLWDYANYLVLFCYHKKIKCWERSDENVKLVEGIRYFCFEGIRHYDRYAPISDISFKRLRWALDSADAEIRGIGMRDVRDLTHFVPPPRLPDSFILPAVLMPEVHNTADFHTYIPGPWSL